jgi:uncharacterized protein
MSDDATPPPAIGRITWQDLTVPDATRVRDFYQAVAGWTAQPVSMDGYDDYAMFGPAGDTPVAGICHARSSNANLPPQWLVYITVADADAAASRAVELGGRVIDGPREMGGGRFAVIADPAGAVAALGTPAPAPAGPA